MKMVHIGVRKIIFLPDMSKGNAKHKKIQKIVFQCFRLGLKALKIEFSLSLLTKISVLLPIHGYRAM